MLISPRGGARRVLTPQGGLNGYPQFQRGGAAAFARSPQTYADTSAEAGESPPNGSSRHTKSTDVDEGTSGEQPDVQADLYEVLDHFSNALAIVQTVSNALQAPQNNLKCPAVGSEIATLRHGVTALIAVHEEFDLAFSDVDS